MATKEAKLVNVVLPDAKKKKSDKLILEQN